MKPNITREILLTFAKNIIGVLLILGITYGMYSVYHKEKLKKGFISHKYETEDYCVYYNNQKGSIEVIVGLDYRTKSELGVDINQDLKVDVVYTFEGSFRTTTHGEGCLRSSCNKETIEKFDYHLSQAIKYLEL